MEEEEDDLYGENGAAVSNTNHPVHRGDPPSEEGEEDEEEEMDEDDSDSDIEIVTERKDGDIPAIVPGLAQRADGAGPTSAAIPIVAPPQQTSTVPSKIEIDSSGKVQVTVQSGLSYPAVRTSTVDVNGNPVYAPLGKPITQVEIDADLVEHEKPWRRPGADQSDYFNYGFDEFTWSTYTLRQKTMVDAISDQKTDNTKFEMMFGGGGGGGGGMMPAMPGADAMAAMAGMGGGGMGMPSQQEFQGAMMEAMRLQGVSDPSKVDFNAFMSQLQGGGMMGQQSVPSGPSAQQQNYGGGNWQGGGGYGRGKRGQRWQ